MVVVTALIMVVGILGTLLPILPGIVLVWIAALAYGAVEGFGWVGWVAFVVITGLGALALWLGVRIPQKAAADDGLPWQGQLFAVGLAIAGFFIIPVVGAAVGFVVGVFAAASVQEGRVALDRTWTILKSLLAATGAQFGLAVAMAVVWAGWVWAA